MSLLPSEPHGPKLDPGAQSDEPRLLTRRSHDDARDKDRPRGKDAARDDWMGAPPRSSFFNGFARLRRRSVSRRQADARPIRRRRFPLRKLLLACCTLVALAAALLLATTLWLRHSMRAALPQLDGALRVAGLTAPVTVTRNAQGVPSITAANLDDLFFAQGFVTAQDRLWQMDMLRRHAAGRLAEILGPSLVEHDRLQRTLQLDAAAGRALAVLPAGQLHHLQDYAAGVNAFLAQHQDHLPIEFHILHYRPAPWTPRDSLLVSLALFQDLSTSFPVKLRREALASHLPAALLADLYPIGSWRDHPPAQQIDLTSPKSAIVQIPLDASQSRLIKPQLAPQLSTPQAVRRRSGLEAGEGSSAGSQDAVVANPRDLLHLAGEFPSQRCSACRSGSNNWAIASSRSASGAPLLSNDMHLALAAPDIWYEASLHAPASAATAALDVTGFTLPGVPFVLVGRNAHVAWSFTNLGADVQDLRIEHLRGAGARLEFERPDGSWSPVAHHIERIRVRGGRDVRLDVLTTSTTIGPTEIQTPILSALLPTERRALSLVWTLYDPANVSLPFFAADTAADGASLAASFAGFGGPSLNLIYADDAGHIGYHALGRIPIRGPAVQHPRAAPPSLPIGVAPPAGEEDEQPSAPQIPYAIASVPSTPEIVTAAPAASYTIGSPISPVPVDALDASQIWSGYIPYDALPSVVDPPGGVLATANARIAPDDYPYALTLDWAAPYRVERIYKQLDGRASLTPTDMLALQNDVYSAFDRVLAQRLAYAIDHAGRPILAHDAARLRQAADILRAWNGDVSAGAAAPTIVAAARAELWPMLLGPQIAAHDHLREDSARVQSLAALYQWEEQDDALEDLVENAPARWLPAGFANWNNLLATAAARALDAAHAPADLRRWRFGPAHPVEIDHSLFARVPFAARLLGVPTGSGPRETGGDLTTIKSIGPRFGPTERFTADLANPQSTFANITTGESGDPASPYYFDQFLPWLRGTTFPLPLHTASTTHTLTLLP